MRGLVLACVGLVCLAGGCDAAEGDPTPDSQAPAPSDAAEESPEPGGPDPAAPAPDPVVDPAPAEGGPDLAWLAEAAARRDQACLKEHSPYGPLAYPTMYLLSGLEHSLVYWHAMVAYAEESPYVSVDAAAWPACEAALADPDSCPDRFWYNDCRDLFAGTLSDGESCLAGFECEGGMCTFEAGECGVCARTAATGEPCGSDSICGWGDYCSQDDPDAPVCVPGETDEPEPGTACKSKWDCGSLQAHGLVCVRAPGSASGICEKAQFSPVGGPCTSDQSSAMICADYPFILRCDGQGSEVGTCIALGGPGEPCFQGVWCDQSVAFCDDDTSTCVPAPGPGEPCTVEGRCAWPLYCEQGVCRPSNNPEYFERTCH